ncbi:MAG: hypothetical protein K6F98_05605 [Bacteroidales bacterium]|nr:hypothetical protein [Bacteroidales bacterium]
MSYASWVLPSKTSGSGNDTISVSGSAHTGRESRSSSITYKATGVADVVQTVLQQGKTEFVTIDATAAVGQQGGTVTINGTSNSSKLTFSLGTGTLLTLPAAYLAGGVSTPNGAAIAGDPGAAQQYNFSITFTGIDANETVDAIVQQLTVTANGGQTANCTVTQAAGDAVLTVSPASITLDADGSPVTVTITSNTAWTLE